MSTSVEIILSLVEILLLLICIFLARNIFHFNVNSVIYRVAVIGASGLWAIIGFILAISFALNAFC